MERTMREGTRPGIGSSGRIMNVILWILQIAAAGMFLMAGSMKLTGNAQMVGMFEAIGFGQWFRYLTGAIETGGAILLLIPRTSGVGALLLAGVMVGAVVTHLGIIGGSPMMPIVLLVVTSVVAWGRRERTMTLLTEPRVKRGNA